MITDRRRNIRIARAALQAPILTANSSLPLMMRLPAFAGGSSFAVNAADRKDVIHRHVCPRTIAGSHSSQTSVPLLFMSLPTVALTKALVVATDELSLYDHMARRISHPLRAESSR